MRNPRTTALCLVLFCLPVLSGCAQTRQLVQNPFTRGAKQRSMQFDMAQVAEHEGHLRKAAEQYRELMKRRPEDARYCHRLGVVQLRLGERDEGIQLLEQALELKPKDPAILNDLGYAYLEGGEVHQAEEHFQSALSITPNDNRTINNLGLCAGYAGRLEEAHQYFRRVGTEAEAQANLAFVLAQRGEIEQAISRYNRALTLNPELKPAAEALVQLAGVSQETEAPETRIARGSAAMKATAVQQVNATEYIEVVPSAPEFAPASSRPETTFGLSAP